MILLPIFAILAVVCGIAAVAVGEIDDGVLEVLDRDS